MIRSTLALLVTPLALVIALSSGCSFMQTGPHQPVKVDADANTQSCLVEMRSSSGGSKATTMKLTGNMFLQDVVDKSQAGRRFGRVNLVVYRKSSQGEGFVKLRAKTRGTKVDPLTNFAIHPGDRVVIIQDTSNFLDDLVDTLKGPLD